MKTHGSAMRFGPTVLDGGGVRFSLWAPGIDVLDGVRLERRLPGGDDEARWDVQPMEPRSGGWYELEVPDALPGELYRFVLPDGLRVPDPASRANPEDVHGPSEIVDAAAYAWRDAAWRGRPWSEAVIYELHVGTFTPEGTFDAARRRLPELAALGITAVELMPVADFPGRRNWGYDGVLLFAPDSVYGRPDELRAFVDEAHALGLMVLLDVVYNHFGPEGNYLHAYCPAFFNPAHKTPWGAAINFDGDGREAVRAFFIHNALYWIEEFHFDGLRLDAVHAIRDDSEEHIVAAICRALREGPGRDRAVHVVLENDLNQARFLGRDPQGIAEIATAQWNDDLHHAAHVLLTGETDGYYLDFAEAPAEQFGRALAQGFLYTGQASAFRGGERRGEDPSGLPHGAFVSFLQTHDQVGNRAFGDRIDALADAARVQAARAAVLLSPHAPMLFMGEEFAASSPFLYFCDFGPELAEAVSRGRREEFGRFAAFENGTALAQIPDPNAQSTFEASRLNADEARRGVHARALEDTRTVLAVRAREIAPRLPSRPGSGLWHTDGQVLYLQWVLEGDRTAARLQMVLNLGTRPAHAAAPPGRTLYERACTAQDGGLRLASGGLRVALEEVPHA
ncbi:MAG: malto-oligosyltrehalose trehalohydrolase [Variovorax paradoxus]|uniref:Malto-oligosyltrehalose trehalohydrolase n=1 Tax=Variovorax paradoxus TaxID=34073 RepID=A0A2W5PUF1_VARPD|nr:MAG: malto-oligosyltrehalose trehalohydrolase [Variovorax paradoxus]